MAFMPSTVAPEPTDAQQSASLKQVPIESRLESVSTSLPNGAQDESTAFSAETLIRAASQLRWLAYLMNSLRLHHAANVIVRLMPKLCAGGELTPAEQDVCLSLVTWRLDRRETVRALYSSMTLARRRAGHPRNDDASALLSQAAEASMDLRIVRKVRAEGSISDAVGRQGAS